MGYRKRWWKEREDTVYSLVVMSKEKNNRKLEGDW